MWSLIQERPALSVPWYLITSWLYYKRDISLLPDEDYDRLCKFLLDRWNSIEHRHKHYVDFEGLSAGTGYALTEYPEIVLGAASSLAREDGLVEWNNASQQWEKAGG